MLLLVDFVRGADFATSWRGFWLVEVLTRRPTLPLRCSQTLGRTAVSAVLLRTAGGHSK
jgi:hypothetical protein